MSTAELLTLIVATHGRRRELQSLLLSIPRDKAKQPRIILVDQNDEDFWGEDFAPFTFGLEVTHVRVPFCHAGRARNLGASLATTEWIAFPDDDCRLLDTTMPAALGLMHDGRYDLISGQIVDEDRRPHLLNWLPHEAAITSKTLDHTFVESSFFIRREIFLSVGGFDPVFGPGGEFASAEGADLMRRLWRRRPGLRAWFTPDIAIYHPDKGQQWDAEARMRIYRFARGEGAFTARHWAVLSWASVMRRIVFRLAGICISTGERRRRKTAYLRGFFEGVAAYWRGRYRWQDGVGEVEDAR